MNKTEFQIGDVVCHKSNKTRLLVITEIWENYCSCQTLETNSNGISYEQHFTFLKSSLSLCN